MPRFDIGPPASVSKKRVVATRSGDTADAALTLCPGLQIVPAVYHCGAGAPLLIEDPLRLLGQGAKVAVEVAVMAVDAGALSGADIHSVGGTSTGADAVLLLKPAHTARCFDLRIWEIVCQPRQV